MNIQHCDGIISRRWPLTIKNYWFGQRPMKHAMPDIARIHSIPEPLTGAINIESWTLLTDLAGTDSDLMGRNPWIFILPMAVPKEAQINM